MTPALAALALLLLTPTIGPVPIPAESPPSPSAQELADSVRVIDLDGAVRTIDLTDAVRSVAQVETEGTETTIALATDILFASEAFELPPSATERIGELLTDVPEDADLQVHGHTDSRIGAVPNDELSQKRAQAVADVVAEQRPDLTLEVAGFADTEPAVAEDPDDPETYAANRRVELRYTS